jgi:adenine-specific DNA glycosylase
VRAQALRVLLLQARPLRALLQPVLPLQAQQALDLCAQWGLRPRGVEKQIERTHIFTHIQWQMRCFYLSCATQAEDFFWADENALDGQYALPTAFRMFRPGNTP